MQIFGAGSVGVRRSGEIDQGETEICPQPGKVMLLGFGPKGKFATGGCCVGCWTVVPMVDGREELGC